MPGLKKPGLILLLLYCLVAQLEARAVFRSQHELQNNGQSVLGRTSQRRMLEELEEEQRLPEEEPLDSNFIRVFSALHDPIAGEAKVFIKMANIDICALLVVCELRRNGTDEVLQVRGEPDQLGVNTVDVELHECFVTCPLPSKGLHFDEITVRTEDSSSTATAEIELVEKLAHGKDKGVGVCVGPLFTESPFFADFLDWYTELGIDHFYVYAAESYWIRARGHRYTNTPGSVLPVQVFHDHRITWRVFYPSQYSVHYNGQALMYNDCAYRARQTQKYLMFTDHDDFLDIKERRPNIKHFLNHQFDDPQLASITFWGSLYNVHCKLTQVKALDTLPGRPSAMARSTTIPDYSGYSAWETDHREPNFTGCGVFDCHPKPVVRPEAVKLMHTHHMLSSMPEFPVINKVVPPHVAFTKHLQCAMHGDHWEEDPNALLCSGEDLMHKSGGPVVTCPAEEVDAYLAGTWPGGAHNRSAAALQPARRLAGGARADRGVVRRGSGTGFQV